MIKKQKTKKTKTKKTFYLTELCIAMTMYEIIDKLVNEVDIDPIVSLTV